MIAYARPLVTALSLDAATLSCNFTGNNTSRQCAQSVKSCFFLGPIDATPGPLDTSPILTNTLLGLDNNGIRVQPLANTGAPGSGPIQFGVPVGVHGVALEITATSGTYAIDPQGLGVDVLGHTILLGLP